MCLPSSPRGGKTGVIPAKDSPSPNSQVSLTCEVLFPNQFRILLSRLAMALPSRLPTHMFSVPLVLPRRALLIRARKLPSILHHQACYVLRERTRRTLSTDVEHKYST